jgi:hemerythrin
MDLLVAHAVQHFSHEEEMFGRVGFPDVEAHANIHAELTRDLALLKQNFDATVAGDEMTGAGGRIKALLVQHVLEQDMKYRDFLHQHKLVPY